MKEVKVVTEYKASYCNAIQFKGGQILIFNGKEGEIDLEIHTKSGWRMGEPIVFPGSLKKKSSGLKIPVRFFENKYGSDNSHRRHNSFERKELSTLKEVEKSIKEN